MHFFGSGLSDLHSIQSALFQKIESAMSTVCNISLGNIEVNSGNVICNSSASSQSSSSLRVVGRGSGQSISISTSQIPVTFDSVYINRSTTINESTVLIDFVGSNFIVSGRSGISCGSFSNVTFFSSDGSVNITSSSSYAAIGTAGNCHSLTFLNGTYFAAGGTGIGSSPSISTSSNQYLETLTLYDGNFTTSGVSGAGIGAGLGYGNPSPTVSLVSNLTIVDGVFTSFGPTGIGSGVGDYGNSTVNSITILNGQFTLAAIPWSDVNQNNGSGAALGSGFGNWGNSIVGSLTITGGSFDCDATGSQSYLGAGIGAGATRSGRSWVDEINITNATVNSLGRTGIGAGTGESGDSFVGNLSITGGEYVL